jgi:hypothetical protein
MHRLIIGALWRVILPGLMDNPSCKTTFSNLLSLSPLKPLRITRQKLANGYSLTVQPVGNILGKQKPGLSSCVIRTGNLEAKQTQNRIIIYDNLLRLTAQNKPTINPENIMKFNITKPRSNPRIIVTVSNNGIQCRGVYIDSKDNCSSFIRAFNDENQALDYLENMKENGSEFSIQVNRINWKV